LKTDKEEIRIEKGGLTSRTVSEAEVDRDSDLSKEKSLTFTLKCHKPAEPEQKKFEARNPKSETNSKFECSNV